MTKLKKCILIYLGLCSAVARGATSRGVGNVARDIVGSPVNFAFNFVSTLCFVIGGAFLFASIVKYIEHRRSPLMVSMSTVVFLFIGGSALIILPLVSIFPESGLRYLVKGY